MNSSEPVNPPSNSPRRRFMQYLTFLGVGGQSLLRSGDLSAAIAAGKDSAGLAPAWPQMAYRTLGRTGWNASRLIFGCGAALSRSRRDDLLYRAFDAGVNVFDVGYRAYYKDAEQNLAPFLKAKRDKIFLISKAAVPGSFGANESISASQAKTAATAWAKLLDASLAELQVEHVDAYYLMGANNPALIASDEIYAAFSAAKQAGKVAYLGFSSHENTAAVLDAAVKTGSYDLAMIAMTPGGWYDWESKKILPNSPPMHKLRPAFDAARAAGIGLIGMKAGRFLAGRSFLGWGNPRAFDEFYEPRLLAAKLSEFQRSYAFVLEHGLDAVNADMQTLDHLQQNFLAAATSQHYFDNLVPGNRPIDGRV